VSLFSENVNLVKEVTLNNKQQKRLLALNEVMAGRLIGQEVDMEQGASFYATAVIGAAPAVVMVAQNDEQFRLVIKQGFEAYRGMGTKEIFNRGIEIMPIDKLQCLARVSWTAVYDRGDYPDISIGFDVHYLIQQVQETPKIFGWISGNEQDVLKEHGII
jgi:hypothetical protein